MAASTRRWRRVVRRVLRPPRSLEERNAWLLYYEIAWFGVVNGIAVTFTSVFAVRLGASNQLLGLLVSLPALVGIVWQLPAARLVERQPGQLRLIVASLFLNRIGYLAIALLPWILSAWRPQALVGIVMLMAIPATLANISFTAMMAEVVRPERRAQVVSFRNMLIYLTTMVTLLITGRMLDRFPFPTNYQAAFFVAFVASMLSLRSIARLRVPGDRTGKGAARRPVVPWRAVLGQQRFRRFAAATFAVNLGLSTPAALYALYRVRNLQASDTWIGLLGTVETAVAVFAAYYWGRQAARRGNRPVLLISIAGLALFPLLTALSPRIEPLLFVAAIGGFFVPAYNIAIFNELLDICPQEGRPTYVGIYNVLLNVALFVAPLVGTTLADWLDVRSALLISAALRLASAGVLAGWMQGERRLAAQPRLQAS